MKTLHSLASIPSPLPVHIQRLVTGFHAHHGHSFEIRVRILNTGYGPEYTFYYGESGIWNTLIAGDWYYYQETTRDRQPFNLSMINFLETV